MLINVKRYLLLRQKLESNSPKVSALPVRMTLELAALGFGRQHDYDTHILLPDNRPKVLNES
jgi:hypothetical protein